MLALPGLELRVERTRAPVAEVVVGQVPRREVLAVRAGRAARRPEPCPLAARATPLTVRTLAPVLFAQPTYSWGYVSVNTIFDHVYLKKDVPAKVQMELVRVSKDNLGAWARQLKTWGFSDVDPKYLALPK